MSAEDLLPLHRFRTALLTLTLLSIAGLAAAQPPAAVQAPLAAQIPAAAQAPAEAPKASFADWLAGVRAEALAKGISQQTVDAALGGIEPLPVVVERDRTQAERVLPLDTYLKRRLTRKLIKTAREKARQHADVLRRVSARYDVPASVIVAIWGLESNFGRFSGVRPTIASLATLAYDNRRAAMFREELLEALRILDRGDVGVAEMKGSWAGAMGQPQFMPSSFLRFAEDFDGDGRADIWRSQEDVFASIANFLKAHGWHAGGTWGRAVKLPAVARAKIGADAPLRTTGCEAARQMTEARPLSRWRQLGVRLEGRQKAPAAATPASLVAAGGRNFLVFENYDALLQYNCAHAYALSVALLADSVGR
jgi:membrane-bound lytic murein transglycosylase B